MLSIKRYTWLSVKDHPINFKSIYLNDYPNGLCMPNIAHIYYYIILMVDYTLYRRFNQVNDHRQVLLSESYPKNSVDFLPAFRYVRQNCTAASSSLSSPSSPSCPVKHMDVEGKCALVVDGTSGVGFAFADELLKMKAAVSVFTQFERTRPTILLLQ